MELPEHVKPQLAKSAPLPTSGDWAYEVKWDGVRTLAYVSGGQVQLESRNLLTVTHQYPELAELGIALADHEAVLDGEIVAFDAEGRPSFQRIQQRLGLRSESAIKLRIPDNPVTYMAFDLLHLDGESLLELPWHERRDRLEALLPAGERFQVPPAVVGDGAAMLEATRQQGLEGVIAKRRDAPYVPGSRTSAWIKARHHRRQEFVVVGWSEGAGNLTGTVGALLIGYHDPDTRKLVYGGSVGTGFTQVVRDELLAELGPLAQDATSIEEGAVPGSIKTPGKWQAIRARDGKATGPVAVHHVEPRLVCEVEFTEFTRDGTLRHPSFKGLRRDKAPADVIREPDSLVSAELGT